MDGIGKKRVVELPAESDTSGVAPAAQYRPQLSQISRQLKELQEWQAEKDAAPLITRDAVLALNKRVDGLLGVMQGLATAMESLANAQADEATESKSRTVLTRRTYVVSVGILLVTVAVLFVTLVK